MDCLQYVTVSRIVTEVTVTDRCQSRGYSSLISLHFHIVLCIRQGSVHARSVSLTFQRDISSLCVRQVLQWPVQLLCNPDDLDSKLCETQWTSSVLSVKCWDSTQK